MKNAKSTMKNISRIDATPPKLATPHDLDSTARQALAAVLNPLVADAFALFVKTKNFHWHMSGSHYRDYHLLLDEQASQIFAMIDVLAERVRKLGETTIHSVEQIQRLKKISDDNDNFVKPKDMLERLMHDNREFTGRMRIAHQLCDECKDVATASLLEVFIDEAERRIWFLYETHVE